jgi:predicted RND superfamily exporter protein
MQEAYQDAGLYAFLGIVGLTLLTFRAVRPALLALVPLAVGSCWTLGIMGLLHMTFNVANLIVLPLIMAPAVESGIMIIYRHREERDRGRRPLSLPQSTGRAVVFSTLSTIIGFGSLMISHHQGIFSIGLLLAIGVASVLLASVTTLPSLLSIWPLPRRTRAERSRERCELSPVGYTTTTGLPRQASVARGK